MEQIASQMMEKIQVSFKKISSYISYFLTKANDYVKSLMGEENYIKAQEFFQKHAFACIFGSMVVAACVFHFRFRRKVGKELSTSSDASNKQKSTSQKLSQKLKGKIKFASSDNEDEVPKKPQVLTTQNYDSTLESKRQFKKPPYKRKQRFQREQEFEQTLQREIRKSKENYVVLDDSKSDKIFNQMYGMYQQALRRQE